MNNADTNSLVNVYNELTHRLGIQATIETVDCVDTVITRCGSRTTETTIDTVIVNGDAMSSIDTVVSDGAEIIAYDISYTVSQCTEYIANIHNGVISPVSTTARKIFL